MAKRVAFVSLFALLMAIPSTFAQITATRLNPSTVEVNLGKNQVLTLDFYGPTIVRLFMDPQGGIVRDPVAEPPAQILVDQPRRNPGEVTVEQNGDHCLIQTPQMTIDVNRQTGNMAFINRRTGKTVTSTVVFAATSSQPSAASTTQEATSPSGLSFDTKSTTLLLSASPEDCFYGGGVQNGRFAHKGTVIAIENTNNWTDGGVASPTPFFWSTAGYGILWHTFAPGKYDFGATDPKVVKLMHETPYLDVFMMIDDGCVPLLNDFYQLTGHPVLLPKFGFYEGHLNAYNRDYWSVVDGLSIDNKMYGEAGSVAFEDGKLYKESQKPVDGGIRESLNGELSGNYQFSARAVIDRYEKANMPLGWVLPNDGYGTGYGQTSTLEGNVENLRQFGDYARSKGVEIGLWTQSDLHPKDGVEALLQRDIVREVRDAGVRVLKTDVAWVGAGYSFGLNGVADVGQIMPYYGDDARPFIISLDGWAGTQRYAGIWTGDQTGGEWEYIRFHLPTYIGSGLSGQPNICSDMDGIFGGRNVPVNVRDFQWKTFTPMQLNMDGWGSNPKYPQALGEPATSINRWYLKLKSMFMPYTYTIAHEAIDGLPMIRPVGPLSRPLSNSPRGGENLREGEGSQNTIVAPALERSEALPPTGGAGSGAYEFFYGPNILVAPIYQNTAADEKGNDIRHNICLPEGQWVDFFSGQCYEGGRIINCFSAPLWKLPVFVKRGAIIPMVHAHNNPNQIDPHSRAYLIIPCGRTEFVAYDDDGRTQRYLAGESTSTRIISDLDEKKGLLNVTVEPTTGDFAGFEPQQATEFVIDLQDRPKRVSLKASGKKVTLIEAATIEEFKQQKNVFFYDAQPQLNRWATPGSEMEKLQILHSPRLYVCAADVDITATQLQLTVEGYTFNTTDQLLQQTGTLQAPQLLTDDFEDGCISPSAYELPLKWSKVQNADYYEIEHAGQLYSTITAEAFTLEGLQPETNYEVRVRAVNKDGKSDWAREKFRTSPDPLRFAIHGITAEATIPDQPGQSIKHLFDFDEGTTWHTAWDKPKSTPFDIIIDLHVVTTIDSIQYVPRPDHGNGTISKYTLEYSLDRQHWSSDRTARYIRMHVEEARGGFGSGQQLYVFRNPDAEMMIPGDINHDNRIDENDFTSYMNYTGLRQGDGDFKGYISRGDLNKNGLIDAYDISTVGIELESGVSSRRVPSVAGTITVTADKKQVNAGDIVTLTVKGTGLVSVNAFSCAIPYDATQWEYVGVDAAGMKEMRNLTYDRLHTSGQKALYPTFINCGEHPYVEGDADLLTIRFRAKQKGKVNLTPQDGMILDKYLNVINW